MQLSILETTAAYNFVDRHRKSIILKNPAKKLFRFGRIARSKMDIKVLEELLLESPLLYYIKWDSKCSCYIAYAKTEPSSEITLITRDPASNVTLEKMNMRICQCIDWDLFNPYDKAYSTWTQTPSSKGLRKPEHKHRSKKKHRQSSHVHKQSRNKVIMLRRIERAIDEYIKSLNEVTSKKKMMNEE